MRFYKLQIKDQVVVNSINNDNNNLCVDFFIRNNKTFGYQEYRKDPENMSEWYRIGNYDHKVFLSKYDAYKDAKKRIVWLE
tara:strand:- start:1703 stop:1945 length:243 start_codon:yes stop_codon:yes gene_type:complete